MGSVEIGGTLYEAGGMKTAIDWESKPEPLRSIGLAFVNDLRRIVGEPSPIRPDEIPDQGGVLLCARRVRAKLRQAELARRSGVSKTTISRLERGELTVSRDTWERIEAALAAAEWATE
jgi:DNA-binding XRE family transcriptional regulator